MEGPFAELEQVPRKAARRGEALGPAKAGSHDCPRSERQRCREDNGRERWVQELYKLQAGD